MASNVIDSGWITIIAALLGGSLSTRIVSGFFTKRKVNAESTQTHANINFRSVEVADKMLERVSQKYDEMAKRLDTFEEENRFLREENTRLTRLEAENERLTLRVASLEQRLQKYESGE